jgi:glycogen(starch) synthase
VSDFYPPQTGGLEAHTRRLACKLKERGHSIAVVTAGTGGYPPPDDGFSVQVAPLTLGKIGFLYRSQSRAFHPPIADPRFVGRLRVVVNAFQPDIVHAHGWVAFSAAAAMSDGPVPVVMTAHDYGLLCPKRTLRRGDTLCEKGIGLQCANCRSVEQGAAKRIVLGGVLASDVGQLVRRLAKLIAVSEYVANRHLQAGVPTALLKVIPNFIDSAIGASSETRPSEQREVLFVGPADPHKGRQVLEDAFALWNPTDWRLVLVGDDAQTGSEQGLNLGRLEGEALWQRYRQAAIVVVPSTWADPCPTVTLEAMAWGRPVVASDVGGLSSIVIPSETGLLVRHSDPQALADALSALATDPPRLDRLGVAGRRRFVDTYSSEAVVPMIEETYREAIRTHPSPN